MAHLLSQQISESSSENSSDHLAEPSALQDSLAAPQAEALLYKLETKGNILNEKSALYCCFQKIFEGFKHVHPELGDLSLYIVDTPEQDAYQSDVHNAIVFGTGLFQRLQKAGLDVKEDRMAAILAHETIHALRRIERDRQRSKREAVLYKLAGHAQEHEADRRGMLLCAEAGYNPKAMIELLQALRGDFDIFFSGSHPNYIDRINHLKNQLESRTEVITNVNTPLTDLSPEVLAETLEERSEKIFAKYTARMQGKRRDLIASLQNAEDIHEIAEITHLSDFRDQTEKVATLFSDQTQDKQLIEIRELLKEYTRKAIILRYCRSTEFYVQEDKFDKLLKNPTKLSFIRDTGAYLAREHEPRPWNHAEKRAIKTRLQESIKLMDKLFFGGDTIALLDQKPPDADPSVTKQHDPFAIDFSYKAPAPKDQRKFISRKVEAGWQKGPETVAMYTGEASLNSEILQKTYFLPLDASLEEVLDYGARNLAFETLPEERDRAGLRHACKVKLQQLFFETHHLDAETAQLFADFLVTGERSIEATLSEDFPFLVASLAKVRGTHIGRYPSEGNMDFVSCLEDYFKHEAFFFKKLETSLVESFLESRYIGAKNFSAKDISGNRYTARDYQMSLEEWGLLERLEPGLKRFKQQKVVIDALQAKFRFPPLSATHALALEEIQREFDDIRVDTSVSVLRFLSYQEDKPITKEEEITDLLENTYFSKECTLYILNKLTTTKDLSTNFLRKIIHTIDSLPHNSGKAPGAQLNELYRARQEHSMALFKMMLDQAKTKEDEPREPFIATINALSRQGIVRSFSDIAPAFFNITPTDGFGIPYQVHEALLGFLGRRIKETESRQAFLGLYEAIEHVPLPDSLSLREQCYLFHLCAEDPTFTWEKAGAVLYFLGSNRVHPDLLAVIREHVNMENLTPVAWVKKHFAQSRGSFRLTAELLASFQDPERALLAEDLTLPENISIDTVHYPTAPGEHMARTSNNPSLLDRSTMYALFRQALQKDQPEDKFQSLYEPSFAEFNDIFTRRHTWLLFPKGRAQEMEKMGNNFNPFNNLYKEYGNEEQFIVAERLSREFPQIRNQGTFHVQLQALMEVCPCKTVVRDIYLEALLRDFHAAPKVSPEVLITGTLAAFKHFASEEYLSPFKRAVFELAAQHKKELLQPTRHGIEFIEQLFPSASLLRNDYIDKVLALNTVNSTLYTDRIKDLRMTPEQEESEGKQGVSIAGLNHLFSGSMEKLAWSRNRKVDLPLYISRKMTEQPGCMLLELLGIYRKKISGGKFDFLSSEENETGASWENLSAVFSQLSDLERREIIQRLLIGPYGLLQKKTSEFDTFTHFFTETLFENLEQRTLYQKIFTLVLTKSEPYKGANIVCDTVSYFINKTKEGETPDPGEVLTLLLSSAGIVGKKIAQTLSTLDSVPKKYRRSLKSSQQNIDILPISSICEILKQQGFLERDAKVHVTEIGELLGAASNKQVHKLRLRIQDNQILFRLNADLATRGQQPVQLGQEVTLVGKFKRPELNNDGLLEKDISILREVLVLLEEEGHGTVFPEGFVEEVKLIIEQELDFSSEARYGELLKKDLKRLRGHKEVQFSSPTVLEQTNDVIIETLASGVSLSELPATIIEQNSLHEMAVMLFMHQILISGNLHVDLHPGNLIYDEKERLLSVIDLGMHSVFDHHTLPHVRKLVGALIAGNNQFAMAALQQLGWEVDEHRFELSTANFSLHGEGSSIAGVFEKNIHALLHLSK